MLAKSKMQSLCLRMANTDQKAFLSIQSTSLLFDEGYQLLYEAPLLNFMIDFVLSVFFLNSYVYKLIKINTQGDIIMTFFAFQVKPMLRGWLLRRNAKKLSYTQPLCCKDFVDLSVLYLQLSSLHP